MTTRRAALEEICCRFDVAILYAFGSRAKEALVWLDDPSLVMPPGPSDLDIGVKALPAVRWTLKEQIDLAQALEDFFGVHRVDLVSLTGANPFLAANIIRGERLYVANQYVADEYDLYVLRRAGDLVPFERERIAQIIGER
ncbi:MAG: nucleotidyltransferase domain-containing protein [Chloroflexi bacterium]|nr:nucleotidyltransferase domain-containing protein [Chloroflexota bacterium]